LEARSHAQRVLTDREQEFVGPAPTDWDGSWIELGRVVDEGLSRGARLPGRVARRISHEEDRCIGPFSLRRQPEFAFFGSRRWAKCF
jgi:hypothetical protein